MALDEQARMIRETVARFVQRELMPLEQEVLQRMTRGTEPVLPSEHQARLGALASELGIDLLDAPAEVGGLDMPASIMVGVFEEFGKTCVPFLLPRQPNLFMSLLAGSDEQKAKYLAGYQAGTLQGAIAISEPVAGGDPAGMMTRAELDGNEWVINGRKIWISYAGHADFAIVMARVGEGQREEGITAFLVDKGTPGFIVEREIPMIGHQNTFGVVFDNCRIPASAVLGPVGGGYAPMQRRLVIRRLEIGSTNVGRAQRALDMMCEHALQRTTFGTRLSDRQAIQWWIADIGTRIHAARLMIADAAARYDRGEDARTEIGMIKVYAPELAYEAVDHAMQTLGALGMTKETALFAMWQNARLARIYEGPSEVHRQAVARRILKRYS